MPGAPAPAPAGLPQVTSQPPVPAAPPAFGAPAAPPTPGPGFAPPAAPAPANVDLSPVLAQLTDLASSSAKANQEMSQRLNSLQQAVESLAGLVQQLAQSFEEPASAAPAQQQQQAAPAPQNQLGQEQQAMILTCAQQALGHPAQQTAAFYSGEFAKQGNNFPAEVILEIWHRNNRISATGQIQ